MFYLYVLKSKKDRELYIGSTDDLKRRLKEHNAGKVESTKPRLPFELIYYGAFRDEKDARKREESIKLRGQTRAHLLRRIKNCINLPQTDL